MGGPLLILAMVVFAAVFGGFAYVSFLNERKRTEAFHRLAGELNFDFIAWDSSLIGALSHFALFSQGRSRRVSNMLRGMTRDLAVEVFDYQYVTGSGKHRHTWRQTVLSFRFDGSRLPAFSLRPENVWHKIGAWLGYQDINFATHPTFSRAYLLRGDREMAIRRLFTDEVLEFFEAERGLSVEGADDRLLVYRHNRRVGPSEVRTFLDDGFRVLAQFRVPARGED